MTPFMTVTSCALIDAGQGKRKYHGKDGPRPTKNLKGNHDSAEDDEGNHDSAEDDGSVHTDMEGLRAVLDPYDTIHDGDELRF